MAFADDGLEAVQRAAELRPDVVLLDVRMPHVDGVEATRRIVEEVSKSGHACAVLILTTCHADDAVRGALSPAPPDSC